MSARVIFDEAKILRTLDSWTVEKVPDYRDNDLLIFVDDTGQEKLSSTHYVYGLGGCLMLGRDYDQTKLEWNKLKSMNQQEFGVRSDVAFHAAKHCHRGSKKRIQNLSKFMREASFKRFFSMVDIHTLTEPSLDSLIIPVVYGVNQQVSQIFMQNIECAHWILEKSDRQSPEIIKVMLQNAAAFRHIGAGNNPISFLAKKAIEPGLEWADIIAWSEGTRLRDQLTGENSKTERFLELRASIIADKNKSISEYTGGFFGPTSVSIPPR